MRLTLKDFLGRHFVKLDEKTNEPLYDWGGLLFCEDFMVGIYEQLVCSE